MLPVISEFNIRPEHKRQFIRVRIRQSSSAFAADDELLAHDLKVVAGEFGHELDIGVVQEVQQGRAVAEVSASQVEIEKIADVGVAMFLDLDAKAPAHLFLAKGAFAPEFQFQLAPGVTPSDWTAGFIRTKPNANELRGFVGSLVECLPR